MALGLMPLVDAVLGHTPSVTTPTAITFAVAIGSGIFLRRRLSWIGLMLHIYGQIAVWLSIFVLSLSVVLLLAART